MSHQMQAEFVSSSQSIEFRIKAPCDIKRGEIFECSITIDTPDSRDLPLVTRGKTYTVTIR